MIIFLVVDNSSGGIIRFKYKGGYLNFVNGNYLTNESENEKDKESEIENEKRKTVILKKAITNLVNYDLNNRMDGVTCKTLKQGTKDNYIKILNKGNEPITLNQSELESFKLWILFLFP